MGNTKAEMDAYRDIGRIARYLEEISGSLTKIVNVLESRGNEPYGTPD